jgi:hypothetical protein
MWAIQKEKGLLQWTRTTSNPGEHQSVEGSKLTSMKTRQRPFSYHM